MEGSMIRKLGLFVLATVGLMVVLAAPTLAGSELPPPNEPNVLGVVVQPPGSTGDLGFTGANVRMWMVVAFGLFVVGALLFASGRRRRANAGS
jgi:hypothetical protein